MIMALLDFVTQLFQRDAEQLEHIEVLNDHCFPATDDVAPVAAGDSYFRLWAVQMFLRRDYEWFKSWYPVVQSVASFRFGSSQSPVDIAQVAGPNHLSNVDPTHLDKVMQLDYALTPLVPFNGGTVHIEAGLVAMDIQGSDLLQRFLDVMGNFASLVAVPQLSGALTIAGTVSKGVETLLGVGSKHMALGYQQTFASAGGGGTNSLHAANIALINTTSGMHKREQLWVKESMLLYGPDSNRAQPLTGVDYMLLRIETRKERDDWNALTSISDPFNKAMNALGQVDTSGNPKVVDADVYIQSAAATALASPDLTTQDRPRVARAIRDQYKKYKDALLGGTWDALTAPVVPDLNTVGTLARNLDASPIRVGELFKE
jgi:hypothetical protein